MQWVLDVVAVPIAEELFWMFFLPFIIISLFNNIGKLKNMTFFKSAIAKLITIILINGISFMVFHVGNADIVFRLAAFLFRVLFTLSIFADELLDVFKKFDVAFSLSLGAHMGHNLVEFGIQPSIQILSENFLTIGLPVIIILFIFIIAGLNKIGEGLGEMTNA